jgi:hypothetical protein
LIKDVKSRYLHDIDQGRWVNWDSAVRDYQMGRFCPLEKSAPELRCRVEAMGLEPTNLLTARKYFWRSGESSKVHVRRSTREYCSAPFSRVQQDPAPLLTQLLTFCDLDLPKNPPSDCTHLDLMMSPSKRRVGDPQISRGPLTCTARHPVTGCLTGQGIRDGAGQWSSLTRGVPG